MNILVIPLVGVGAGVASIFGAPYVIGALGFQSAGIAASSVAASVQSALYAGAVPAGGWFAALQSAGATGAAISHGTGAMIGMFSSGATYFWRRNQ